MSDESRRDRFWGPVTFALPIGPMILRYLAEAKATEAEQRAAVDKAVQGGQARSAGAEGRSMNYYYYDTVVFRRPPNGFVYDRWLRGEWKPATGILYPSYEEYLHLREISEEEARERCGPAAFTT